MYIKHLCGSQSDDEAVICRSFGAAQSHFNGNEGALCSTALGYIYRTPSRPLLVGASRLTSRIQSLVVCWALCMQNRRESGSSGQVI